MPEKPRTYAEAVEEQADFEELVREDDSYEKAVRDEGRGREPKQDGEEAVSGT